MRRILAYLDCNYGGVFIFWDRLFGTFQEEDDDEPVIFGVTTPLASWNPLWANLQFYAQLWADARRTAACGTSCASGSCPPVGARRMWRRLPHPKQDLARFASSRLPCARNKPTWRRSSWCMWLWAAT
jgi:hypothetical protein